MLQLGIPVGNVHCSALIGGPYTALHHLLAVKERLHRILARSGNPVLCGSLADKLGMYPAGTEAGGTKAVLLISKFKDFV